MFTRSKFLVPVTMAASLLPMIAAAAPMEGRSEDTTFPQVRMAEEGGMKPNFGALVGYTDAVNDGISQDASFGLELGFRPIIPISLGAQWQYTPGSLDQPGPKVTFNTSNFLLKAAYNFGGDIPIIRNTYLGGKSGAVINTLEGSTKAKFAVGPVLGMDFPVDANEKFSLGAELSYLGIIGDNTPDPYSALGAMRYWF